ncbi:MAG: hypothetical protein Q4C70_01820 [Planctomycetia bacterium]|nr:hypothetical protein [Planctomycetia bacterium]
MTCACVGVAKNNAVENSMTENNVTENTVENKVTLNNMVFRARVTYRNAENIE